MNPEQQVSNNTPPLTSRVLDERAVTIWRSVLLTILAPSATARLYTDHIEVLRNGKQYVFPFTEISQVKTQSNLLIFNCHDKHYVLSFATKARKIDWYSFEDDVKQWAAVISGTSAGINAPQNAAEIYQQSAHSTTPRAAKRHKVMRIIGIVLFVLLLLDSLAHVL